MRLLVMRISAMGDVALTLPVLTGFTEKYPDAEVVMLTSASFKPFFSSLKLTLFHPDLRGRHKGPAGLLTLFRDLRKTGDFDAVIDIHDVLRTKVLRTFFWLSGVKVFVIDKGRKEKRALIKGKRKLQLKHMVIRYCDTFTRAGFPLSPSGGNYLSPSKEADEKAASMIDMSVDFNIGLAPFAKHALKRWPVEYMISLMNLLREEFSCRFWLFGGREELESLEDLSRKIPGTSIASGKLTLEEELSLMQKLDMMIAMDSSNMHMAALAGTKVISIWGGTDPLTGFGAWMQPESFSIRIPVEELDCRPCTIYGRGKTRNGFACMKRLTPELVFRRIIAAGIIEKK